MKQIQNSPTMVMSIIVLLSVLAVYVFVSEQNTPTEQNKQHAAAPIEAPVPEVTVWDSLVNIEHYTPDGTIAGYGVLLLHRDVLFVLTSNMLFPKDVGSITVITVDGIEHQASFLDASEELGLVAIHIDEARQLVSYELTDDPNLPPGVKVSTGNVLTYMRKNPDWMIVDGGPYLTGEPLIHQDDLVGIVVGVNSLNENQAIVAGNHALVAFANSIIEQTTEETKDDVQENDKGRSVQKVRKTKSNPRRVPSWGRGLWSRF